MEDKENQPKNELDNKSRGCCLCNLPNSGDFKQVISLRNSGLKVFIHKNVEVQKTTRKKSEETFILHNTGKELKRPDYISEMCQYKTKCIKCKTLLQKVRCLIDEIDDIKTDEVIGVCEYCKRSNAGSKCRRCEYIISKYLSLKTKVYQNKQARFVAWLTKINDLLRNILETESICKHKLYQDSHSVLELEQLLSEIKSPLSQRQPEITFFPTTAAEQILSFSALGQSKEMLEDILKRIHTEKSTHYTSDDSLLLSSSRSSTGCVCKYFMSKKMEGRRSMEVLPQEKYYPPGLITSREFARSLTSEQRFRGSLDRERRGRRRPSSAEYYRKKSGYHSDVSRDGTSKERGGRYVLRKISSEFSERSQASTYSRDEYWKGKRSRRDEYGSARGSKRDEYGKERGSKRDDYGSARGSHRDDYGNARGSRTDEYGSSIGSKRDEYRKEKGPKRDEYGSPRASKRDEYGSTRGSKKDEYGKERVSKRDEYGKERRSRRDEYGKERVSKRDEYEKESGSKRDGYGNERVSKRDEYGMERGSRRDEYGKERVSKRDEYGKERGSKRDEYGNERVSKRDEYGKERGSKRDESGKEKGSRKEIPPGSKDKMPSQKRRVGEEISIEQKGKSKRESSKEEKLEKRHTVKEVKTKEDKLKGDTTERDKKYKAKETIEKGDTKDGKSKADILKEDTTKGDKASKTKETVDKEDTKEGKSKSDKSKEDTTKTDKIDKTKETVTDTDKVTDKEDTKEGKSKADKLKEDIANTDRKGKTKEDITKKDVKLGDSVELIFKGGKTKKNKSGELNTAEGTETKTKKDTSKADNLEKDKKGKGKTDEEEDITKQGKKGEKDTSKEDDLKKKKKREPHPGDKSKKLRDDRIIGELGSKQKIKKDIKVIIKDEETRKRLKDKSKSKSTPEQDKDKQSEESVSDNINVETPNKKKGKGKGESEKKQISTTNIPIKKKKPSSEAVLLLKMMKDLRMKREKEKEAKKEKLKEFADIAPLPIIKRRVKPKVEPLISESFVECDDNQVRKVQDVIIGKQIVPFDPNFKFEEDRDHEPLLFEIMQSFPDVVLPQIPSQPPPPPPADGKKISLASTSSKMKSKSKMLEEFTEGTAGIVKYQLSNRKYIEDGWTVLPTTKILRKMNTYNMKLANPEFDFFNLNKKRKIIYYDTGEKLAEIYSNETGKWFYRNGNLALRCYNPKEPNVRKRYLVYSSGDVKENGTFLPITILGVFDQLGNAIIYDHFGNARLKYNQSEGVIIDEKIGPPGRWKWHTLNDPPMLQPVFIDSYVQERDEDLDDLIRRENEMKQEPSRITKDQNVDMIMIEFENFVKEKAHKILQKFKPFQIRMKAVKINEHFSIRILDQASVTLLFQDTPNTLKLNLGMNLINTEIVDTETSEVSEVATPYDRIPARTESVSNIQEALNKARKYGKSIRNRMHSGSTVKKPRGVSVRPNIPFSRSPIKLPAY